MPATDQAVSRPWIAPISCVPKMSEGLHRARAGWAMRGGPRVGA